MRRTSSLAAVWRPLHCDASVALQNDSISRAGAVCRKGRCNRWHDCLSVNYCMQQTCLESTDDQIEFHPTTDLNQQHSSTETTDAAQKSFQSFVAVIQMNLCTAAKQQCGNQATSEATWCQLHSRSLMRSIGATLCSADVEKQPSTDPQRDRIARDEIEAG